MNKKMMLIPILALLLLSVPVAIAGNILIIGDGEYSQTTEFGDVSDAVTLTGDWVFESNWGYGSGPDIYNYVTLNGDSTYSEHAISPRGIHYLEGLQYWSGSDEDANPGLNLQTIVHSGDASIHDVAEIQLRGYDFTFTADTSESYTSTKFLRVLDSYYNVLEDGAETEYMDWARFQVTDTTDSIYVVGGMVEYEENYPNQGLTWTKLNFMQTFTQGSDISSITIYHSVSDWVRSTAFFGYDTAGELGYPLDWYAEVNDETTPFTEGRDAFYASFVDDEAHFSALYGKPGIGYTLDAYSSIVDDDFDAWGNVVDVDWEFTGSTLHRTNDPTGDGMYPMSYWSAYLDMEP